jgi:putative hydrolase
VSQEPFGDIPLFRELQRLLASSEGPINNEMARQIAVAVATRGATPRPPEAGAARSFEEAVRSSEPLVAGYTRLVLDEPARTTVLDARSWVTATLQGWRWLLERVARRLVGELGGVGDENPEGQPLGSALAQVGPLLMGIQIGTLIGHLAHSALARYDLPIPLDDDRRLFLVADNARQVADDYGLSSDDLYAWIALHEVARHLVMSSVPWLHRYLESLLIEVVDAIEIDAADVERRFLELQSGGMESLEAMTGANVLPIVSTERHSRALGRLRAFLALFEGYADHAAGAVSSNIVGDVAKVDEGMARRRAAPNEGQAMLGGILGISMDRTLGSAGVTFCAAITRLEGPEALNRVWEAPDNLPSHEEIKDPFLWMERHST